MFACDVIRKSILVDTSRFWIWIVLNMALQAHKLICLRCWHDLQVHVPVEPRTEKRKGFAYVLFEDAANAQRALQDLDGTPFQGRLLHILPAAAKKVKMLDDYAISKLPIKKQKQIRRKAEAGSSTFKWNSLYMSVCANLCRFPFMNTHCCIDRCCHVVHLRSTRNRKVANTGPDIVRCRCKTSSCRDQYNSGDKSILLGLLCWFGGF